MIDMRFALRFQASHKFIGLAADARGQEAVCVSSYLSATVDKPRSLSAFCRRIWGLQQWTMMRGMLNAYSFKVGSSNHIIADSAYDRADWW